MVNMPKPTSSTSSYISNRFSDRESHPVHECAHCHIKGHSKDRCYKLIAYHVDHPYHPNNKGKRRPAHSRFSKPTQAITAQANVVVHSQATSENAQLSTRMEELQTQLTTLMQCINKGPSPVSSPYPGTSFTASQPQYSMATHIAGPIPEEGIGSW
ncbi:uncharacterized protein LOC141700906 [Apium graveolens]|uniref:uncharacterized protein LOC141700906 n=1 Tax=Apium graveolens TaxID=4045 RepID=UPI003D7BB3C6